MRYAVCNNYRGTTEKAKVGEPAFSIMASNGERNENSIAGAISGAEVSESEGTDNFGEEACMARRGQGRRRFPRYETFTS